MDNLDNYFKIRNAQIKETEESLEALRPHWWQRIWRSIWPKYSWPAPNEMAATAYLDDGEMVFRLTRLKPEVTEKIREEWSNTNPIKIKH